MKTKYIILLPLFLGFTLNSINAQFRLRTMQFYGEYAFNSRAETPTENYKAPVTLFGLNSNFGGKSLGMFLECNYKSRKMTSVPNVSLKNFVSIEASLGVRYFPVKPTIMAGKIAIRPTLGAAYGIDFGWNPDATNYGSTLFAGFCFTPITSLTGVFINVVHRTNAESIGGFNFPSYTSLRFGILYGPSAKK
jgi:hypothetical protein